MKKITFTKMRSAASAQYYLDYTDYPGYLLVSASHPGWEFVVCRRSKRTDTTKGYALAKGWSLYDRKTGFYLGMHMDTRKACEARARVYLSTALKEQLKERLLLIQVGRAKQMLAGM